MTRVPNTDDTIAAISTPSGAGGIGIVRLSGPNALEIADIMFQTKKGKKPSQFKSYTVRYGHVIRDPGNEIIDEALLTVMRAPKSYTREDVVEISCHGGRAALEGVLNLAIELGARLAEPGEFTKRAFLNGRMDLTQAEAVLDIIQAKTEAFLRVSTHQLKGDLTSALEGLREQLMNVYTEIEAAVNFPDEAGGGFDKDRLKTSLIQAHSQVYKLIESGKQGRVLKEGIKVVICGKTNVGKSSVLNVLLRTPRAIVSPIAGTTRDTIEEVVQMKGVPFQLVDTAGILEPRDLIEEEAVRRSHMYVKAADLILLIFDGSEPLSKDDIKMAESLNALNMLIVLNKCDLPKAIEKDDIQKLLPGKEIIDTSATQKQGFEILEERIIKSVLKQGAVDTQSVLLSNMRHIQALKECASYVTKAMEALTCSVSLEFISEDLKAAVNKLDQITGREIDADLLDKIFADFCIGK